MPIKSYWDESEDKRIWLTRDQLDKYIKQELMIQGVVVPVEPDPPPKIRDFKKEFGIIMYSVGGLLFHDMEAAENVLKMSPLTLTYDWSIGSEYKYCEPISGIVGEVVFTKETLGMIKSEAKAAEKAKEDYKSDLSEFKEAMKRVDEITEAIVNDYARLSRKMSQYKKIRDVYNEYYEKAGDQAMFFLEKAYSVADIAEAREVLQF